MFPLDVAGSLQLYDTGTQRLTEMHEAVERDEVGDWVILELQQQSSLLQPLSGHGIQSELDFSIPNQELGIQGMRPTASNKHIKPERAK